MSNMKAIIQNGYGSPARVLRLDEVDKPTLDPDRALVRVRASSVNSGDWRQVLADPLIVRVMSGLRRPKNPSVGGDFAGVVEAVGADITDVNVGDEVFGIRTGAFADYVATKMAVAKPANMTFEQAAAIPVAALTALQALRDKGEVIAGEQVLINGAGGGVGHFAVQIAKALGAEVTAVTSTDKVELVRSVGADHVIDYRREDYTQGAARYDLIVDVGGNKSFRATRRALKPGGRIVIVGSYNAVIARLIFGTIRHRVLRQKITFFLAQVNKQDLLTLKDMAEAGKLRPVIERTYSLEQTADAIDYAAKQTVAGKISLTVPA
jgi:NADPH:quinone reductase-like Zn-dependent oxidoreductase